MNRYVNHHAIVELFEVVDADTNPVSRADLLERIEIEFVERLLHAYERTAWELKQQQWNLGQISQELGFSERRVKRMIYDFTHRTGAWNPLARRVSVGAIDIRHLVDRRDERSIAAQEHSLVHS
jgi:AraC-like DNA-binding protein